MQGVSAQITGSRYEVAVVGAGAAGLAAALASAQAGVPTALVGRHAPVADGRTVALLDGSVRFLKALGAWDEVGAKASPLCTLQIIDDTGSLFRPPPARFHSSEIGLEAFGWNVESAHLVAALRRCARQQTNLTLIESDAAGSEPGEEVSRIGLADGGIVEARLVVGADGNRSPLRQASGVKVREWTYPQSAITTILAHAKPHEDVSTEFHTRSGPFTLVPMPGGHRSSLVWVNGKAPPPSASPRWTIQALPRPWKGRREGCWAPCASMGRAVWCRCGGYWSQRQPPRASPSSARPRMSSRHRRRRGSISDCATPPPSGMCVVRAHRDGRDPGSRAVLSGYANGRRIDAAARTAAVDVLNRSLLTDLLPLDLARGLGLLAMANLGPLRRMVMRERSAAPVRGARTDAGRTPRGLGLSRAAATQKEGRAATQAPRRVARSTGAPSGSRRSHRTDQDHGVPRSRISARRRAARRA